MNKYWNPEFDYALTAPNGNVIRIQFQDNTNRFSVTLEETSNATIPDPKTINEIGDELAESAS